MSEKSNVQRMLNEQADYQGKLAADPIPDRGPAQSGPSGPPSLAKPVWNPPLAAAYRDTAAATRARNAETDKNLSTAPKATKP